jgi:hypothetical protein
MKTNQKTIAGSIVARILILISFLLPWATISAQDFTKVYKQKYDVERGANLIVQNKFGDINCQAWDENSIDITVTVKVDASSQEKANRVFEKIGVALSGNRTKVEGITTVGNINNADFSIYYEIRMPSWVNIDLNNKFGDIFLDETDGLVKINLEYGAMEANAFNGLNTELMVKFSKVKAGFMKDGTLKLEYSQWESKSAENIRITSRFGEITIDKITKLNLDSQYDEINIGSAGQVISISRFSELEFGKINGDFDFDIEYGELDVDFISAAFKLGKVRNTFAEASLVFDPRSSVNINAEMRFGELTYPKAVSMNHEIVGYTTNIYKGKIGASASPGSSLSLNSKNADVKISFAN